MCGGGGQFVALRPRLHQGVGQGLRGHVFLQENVAESMQDRTNLTPELLQRMRRELVELLSKYVEMDKDALELNFDQEGDQMALMLSIPVIRAKDEKEIEEALKAEDEAKASEEESDTDETEENSEDDSDDESEDEESDGNESEEENSEDSEDVSQDEENDDDSSEEEIEIKE